MVEERFLAAEALMQAEDFMGWLRHELAEDAGRIVGRAGDGGDCPISRYLREEGGCFQPCVYPSTWSFILNGREVSYTMPHWGALFVAAIDGRDYERIPRAVSAAEALSMMEEVTSA